MSNGNARKLEKEKWVSIAVREEVDLLPAGVIVHLLKHLQIIEEENAELVAKLDKQAAELYAAMEELRQVKNLKNTSVRNPKPFHMVGPRQQQQDLDKIRYTNSVNLFNLINSLGSLHWQSFFLNR